MRDNVRSAPKITVDNDSFAVHHDYHVDIRSHRIYLKGIRTDEHLSFRDMDCKSIIREFGLLAG